MRRTYLLVLAVLMAGCSESPAEVDEGLAAGTGAIVGVVVDETIQPLEGATVEASRPDADTMAASTAADGRFGLFDLEPGLYVLTVRAPGYIDLVTTATVVADEETADLVLKIQEERSTKPFVKAIHWKGILGCGTSGSNLCSAPEQATGEDLIPEDSVRLFWDEVVSEGKVPQYIQAEIVWEPNVAAFDDLNLLLGSSTPPSWQQFQYERRYPTTVGPSPIVGSLNQTILEEDQIGTERGLVLELYGGGYDIDNAGASVDQEFEAFIHLFYYHTPPEDWQFSTSGDP